MESSKMESKGVRIEEKEINRPRRGRKNEMER